jgi:excisionase family DNA binding protein
MKTIVDDNKEPGLNPGEILIAIIDAARKTLNENGNGTSPKEETERIYTAREAADLLRYKTSYIYEMVKRGEMAAIRHGKYITIRDSAIRDFIARNERRGD